MKAPNSLYYNELRAPPIPTGILGYKPLRGIPGSSLRSALRRALGGLFLLPALLALSFCSSPAGGGGGGDETGIQQGVSIVITSIPAGYQTGGGTYSGVPQVTVNSTSLNVGMNNGAIVLRFPASLKQLTSQGAIDIKIPEALIGGIANGIPLSLKFEPGLDSNNEISIQDAETIRQRIVDEIKKIVVNYNRNITYSNGATSSIPGSGQIGDLITIPMPMINYESMVTKDAGYTSNVPNPNPTQDVTLWGLAAKFAKDTATNQVTLTMPWNGSVGGDLSAISGSVVSDFVTGKNIIVAFNKTGNNTGSDRVSFGKIAELKSALAGATSVNMSGNGVDPLFNAYDAYAKVFNGSYTNNSPIFNGYTVKKNGTKWYIEAASGKKVYADVLGVYGVDAGLIDGFGLKVADRDDLSFTGVAAPTISGKQNASSGSNQLVIPSDLNRGFELLKMDSVSDFPIFTLTGLGVANDRNLGTTQVNLAGTRFLSFMERYMDNTTNKGKLNSELVLNGTSYISVAGSNVPYTNNGIATSNRTDVNGNLAVWLGSKGVALREVYLTNPNLYSSTPTTLTQTVRNAVLEGNDWKQITMNGAGVIVSKDTPVAGIPGSSNLWYVVQGHSGDNYNTTANVKVLEVSNATAAGKLGAPSSPFSIQGLIVPNDTVRNALTPNFVPTTVYNNGTRPSINWETYANNVKNTGSSSFALAPMDNSIRLAEGKTDARDNDYLRMLGNAGVSVTFFLDKFLSI